MNLFEETLNYMNGWDKSTEDIMYIGLHAKESKRCTLQQFQKIADREYDNRHGASEVADSLIVIFRDYSWLRRWEYEGSEGWEYVLIPAIPMNTKELTLQDLWEGEYD